MSSELLRVDVIQKMAAAYASGGTGVDDFVERIRTEPRLSSGLWATEEMLRLDPNIAAWRGSLLKESVWGPPGSPGCPFKISSDDIIRLNQKH